MSAAATVWEIYSAIQGEGLGVGERTVFLRVAGCNLDCRYCDTPARSPERAACAVEEEAGSRTFRHAANPVRADAAAEEAVRLAAGPPPARWVSLTGGEPLLAPDFVAEAAGRLRGAGIAVHLETNGTLPDALEKVVGLVDRVAMDVKLPSATGGAAFWEDHRRFLSIARRTSVFVKAVVTWDTTLEDLDRAVDLIARVDRTVPFVLQPATPARGVERAGRPAEWRRLEARAARDLEHVRVIPQVHRVLDEP